MRMKRRIMNYEPAPQPIDILLVEDNEATYGSPRKS